MKWISGKALGIRCSVWVHRKPYTQADRGQCARWASYQLETEPGYSEQYRCAHHVSKKARIRLKEQEQKGT